MENNTEAISILNKLIKEVESFGIVIKKDVIIENLKKIREIALKEENPRMVKATRLTYEHIEANDGFYIPIPADEPVNGFEDSNLGVEEEENSEESQKESLLYLLSIMKDPKNRTNAADLKEYNEMMKNYAELG